MVNTFLVCSDFRKSAKKLDSLRLGKQRVEAFQILNLCYSLHFLANQYKNPVPKDPYLYHSWIREIAQRYKKENYRILIRDSLWNPEASSRDSEKSNKTFLCGTLEQPKVWVKLEKNIKIYKQKPAEKIVDINFKKNIVTLETSRSKGKISFPLEYSTFVGRYDLYISLGFVYHPAVAMWLGHEIALEQYINAHVEEWEKRGNQNTMRKYINNTNYSIPPWCSDPELHYSHKSNLLTKERDREEKPWYCNLKDFTDIEFGKEYIWPYSQKYDTEKKYI